MLSYFHMMDFLETFAQTGNPVWMSQLVPFAVLLIPLAIADLALKGWAMWRAAKMNMKIWFIALLLVNSLGIVPAIFLLVTKDEYAKRTA